MCVCVRARVQNLAFISINLSFFNSLLPSEEECSRDRALDTINYWPLTHIKDEFRIFFLSREEKLINQRKDEYLLQVTDNLHGKEKAGGLPSTITPADCAHFHCSVKKKSTGNMSSPREHFSVSTTSMLHLQIFLLSHCLLQP